MVTNTAAFGRFAELERVAEMARSKQLTPTELRESIEKLGASRDLNAPHAAVELASRIQQLIISQDLAEGSRLPSERDLSEMLSTSRPTISQAIRILVVQGLVESRRGSGAYVRRHPEDTFSASVDLMLDLNHDSVRHLADLRLWLETTGITEAIENAGEDEIAASAEALEQLRDSAGDIASWMSADTRFHATIVSAAHNPYLSSIYERVHNALINYEYRAWIARGVVPKWLRASEVGALNSLHEPILRALVERDPEAGRIAVLHHHYVMAQHLAASRT